MIDCLQHRYGVHIERISCGGAKSRYAIIRSGTGYSCNVSEGIVDPDTKVKEDGSVDFRSKQPLLRQEASALLDIAFRYYTLPIKTK